MSEDIIKEDILYLTKRLVNPFNSINPFSEQIKYLTATTHLENDMIIIEINILIFEQNPLNLYTIYSKPINHKNKAYLFKLDNIKFTTSEQNTTISFSRLSFNQNCFISKNTYFCKNNIETINCLQTIKQPKANFKNYITQINKEIYFTIFKPINLQINIIITTSSEIIKNDHNITTSFFTYNTNEQDKYRIFM